MSRIPAPKDLGSLITRLERRVDALARSTRLAYSSIDDAAVSVVDANGTLRGVIGQQYDGTTAVNIVNGPPPPTPSLPDVEGAIGGVYVMWDGTFTDALVAPMDFQRVEVHVAKTPGYIPTGLTLMATIESPQGGCATLPLRDYVPWYVVLVTRTTSGRAGTPSAVGSATPRQVAQPDLDPLLSIPTEIADGSITSVMIADSAITAPKVAASAIVAGKIAANAITAGTIDANAVTAREVASNQINAAHIAAGSISALLVAGDIITTQPTPVNGTSRVVVDQAGIRLVSRSSAGVDTDRVNLNTGTGSGTFTGTIVGSSFSTGGGSPVEILPGTGFSTSTSRIIIHSPGDEAIPSTLFAASSVTSPADSPFFQIQGPAGYDYTASAPASTPTGYALLGFTPQWKRGLATDRPARITVSGDLAASTLVVPSSAAIQVNPATGGAVTDTVLQLNGGLLLSAGTTASVDLIRSRGSAGATLTSTGHPFQIGADSAPNLRLGTSEVQAVNNGATASLKLNPAGGSVDVNTTLNAADVIAGFTVRAGGTTIGTGVNGRFQSTGNTVIPIVCRAVGTGQTANLQEWQSWNGTTATVVAKVAASGAVTAAGLTVSGAVGMDKKIQVGTVNITPTAANTLTTRTVSFVTDGAGVNFDVSPMINVTAITTADQAVTQCTAAGQTATGFTIYLKRTNTTNTTVHWIAVAP